MKHDLIDRSEWWLDGKLHREGGPARVWLNGTKEWWRDAKLHRKNGPAITYHNGTKAWLIDDRLHREDGPAVEYHTGQVEWWLEGEQYDICTWNRITGFYDSHDELLLKLEFE